jgi:hypothetical protein
MPVYDLVADSCELVARELRKRSDEKGDVRSIAVATC